MCLALKLDLLRNKIKHSPLEIPIRFSPLLTFLHIIPSPQSSERDLLKYQPYLLLKIL